MFVYWFGILCSNPLGPLGTLATVLTPKFSRGPQLSQNPHVENKFDFI